jgi:hypothetical protein
MVHKVGTSRCDVRGRRSAAFLPLDFLRSLRIKNAVESLCIIRYWVFYG